MHYVATVQILVRADSQAEACDGISGMLRECGCPNFLIDWAYFKQGNEYIRPSLVTIPKGYREGDMWTTGEQ